MAGRPLRVFTPHAPADDPATVINSVVLRIGLGTGASGRAVVMQLEAGRSGPLVREGAADGARRLLEGLGRRYAAIVRWATWIPAVAVGLLATSDGAGRA